MNLKVPLKAHKGGGLFHMNLKVPIKGGVVGEPLVPLISIDTSSR